MVARFWAYPILFAGFFTLGLLRPEMPGILLELFNGTMSNVATYQGICDGFSALFAFFAVPLLGSYCDRVGRKQGLAISAACAAMPVFVLATYELLFLPKTLTLGLYFFANLVSRVTTQSVVFSYVADCSPTEKRAAALVEAGGVLYLAQTMGPSVAKYLSREYSLLIAASLSAVSIAYSFVIPESNAKVIAASLASHPSYGTVDHEKGGGAETPKGNIQQDPQSHGQGKGVLVGLKFLYSNSLYTMIALILFFSQMAMSGIGQIYYLYLTEEFHFTRSDNIMCAMIGGAETCVIMLLIQPRLTKYISLSTAMAFAVTNYFIYCLGLAAIATNKMEVYLLIIFYGFAAVMFSSTNALLASVTMPHQLGLAMGALAAIKAFASGFGSLVFGLFFGFVVSLKQHYGEYLFAGVKYTTLPFLAGCVIAGVSLIGCLFLPLDRSTQPRKWKDTVIRLLTLQRVLAACGSQTNNEEYTFLPSYIAMPYAEHKQMTEERQTVNPSTKPPPSPSPSPSSAARPHMLALRPSKWLWSHDTKNLPKTPKFLPSGQSHDDDEILAIPSPPERTSSQRLTLFGALCGFIVLSLVVSKVASKSIEAAGLVEVQSASAEFSQFTVISLLGPPGVGKSALSRHITPDFGFVHVSTGDLIREEIAAGTEIGNRTAAIVKAGGLVDDATVTLLIEKKLSVLQATATGIILDGFPRRLSQAKLLDSGEFKIPHLAAVVSVTMPDEILAIRRGGRRTCPVCGATYNLHEVNQDGYYLKARMPCNGVCCVENATLVPRPDDEPSIAADRMRVYHEETPAMLKYYKKQRNLIEIEKKRQMKIVYRDIKPKLTKLVRKAQAREEKNQFLAVVD